MINVISKSRCRAPWLAIGLSVAIPLPAFAQKAPAIDAAANGDKEAALSWNGKSIEDAKALALPRANLPREISTSGSRAIIPRGASVHTSGKVPQTSDKSKPALNTQFYNAKTQPMAGASAPAAPAASFGFEGSAKAPFSSSRLIPSDARLNYPYSAVGKLLFETGRGQAHCTAAVIGPRLILTAGHCVHTGGAGGQSNFYRDFVFIPAFYRGNAPFGAWSYSWVTTTSEWAASNGNVPNSADFAILELRDKSINGSQKKIADVTGAFGVHAAGSFQDHMKILGYPANFDQGQEMHQVDSQYFNALTDFSFVNGSDMTQGSSGGPWVQNFGIPSEGQPVADLNVIVGVTSYGPSDPALKIQGTSLPGNRLAQLYNSACDHRPDNCFSKIDNAPIEGVISSSGASKPSATEKTAQADARPPAAAPAPREVEKRPDAQSSEEGDGIKALIGKWLIGSGEVLRIMPDGSWLHPSRGAARIKKADDIADIRVTYESGGAQCSYRVSTSDAGQTLNLIPADQTQDSDYCPDGRLKKLDGEKSGVSGR